MAVVGMFVDPRQGKLQAPGKLLRSQNVGGLERGLLARRLPEFDRWRHFSKRQLLAIEFWLGLRLRGPQVGSEGQAPKCFRYSGRRLSMLGR